jgi:uncharacterized protein DUF2849
MSNAEKGQALTANRLVDGEVVFLTRSGLWSVFVDEAALAQEPDAVKALEARGREAEAANIVTGSYLFEAERHDGRMRAAHIRERIRTLGPTVRPDLGKQALGSGGAFSAVQR